MSKEPKCIYYLHRFGIFHKPDNNKEEQIVVCVFLIIRYRQFCPSRDLYELVDDDKNQIVIGAFFI